MASYSASLDEAGSAADALGTYFSYAAGLTEVAALAEDFLSTTALLDGSADRIVYALSESRIVYSVDEG